MQVTKSDIKTCAGVLHIVDSVLVPAAADSEAMAMQEVGNLDKVAVATRAQAGAITSTNRRLMNHGRKLSRSSEGEGGFRVRIPSGFANAFRKFGKGGFRVRLFGKRESSGFPYAFSKFGKFGKDPPMMDPPPPAGMAHLQHSLCIVGTLAFFVSGSS